jgi:hypothetical protein
LLGLRASALSIPLQPTSPPVPISRLEFDPSDLRLKAWSLERFQRVLESQGDEPLSILLCDRTAR